MFRIMSYENVDLSGKKLLVRLDLNSPIDPKTGKIIDDTRLRIHAQSIKKLLEKDPALVLLSHQGRPGEADFTDLSQHAEILSRYSGVDIRFIPDIIGPTALNEIKEMRRGEVILLDNVRFLSEELIEAPPEVQSKTFLVKRLSPLIDLFINDAFATAHRSQPSIVGFPPVLRSCAGPVMIQEIRAISKILGETDSPKIFVLGGAKIIDTIRVIENISRKRLADRILTTGLVALLFQVAKGVKSNQYIMRVLESRGLLSLVQRARRLIIQGAPIETPIDYRVLRDNNEVSNDPAYRVSGAPLDIGEETIEMYSSMIKEANLVVMRGPAGYIEDPRFSVGTKILVEEAINSKAYVIIGGGHLNMFVPEEKRGLERIHVSSGGGALLEFLSQLTLPAIEALEYSYRRFWGGEN